jgi:hypothetical protein
MPRKDWGRLPAFAAVMLLLPLGMGRAGADDLKRSNAAEAQATADVSVLDAMRDGRLEARVFGNGEDRVHLVLQNTSPGRLHVVLPAGLIAASSAGQFGGGGGIQSMGLGAPTSNNGSFGAFQAGAGSGERVSGFQSVGVEGTTTTAGPDPRALSIAAGQTLEIDVPSVCLNYGDPTPTPKDEFRLVMVEDYTSDARARKALRSLATLGTSQKVAQAVVWNVFNGLSFDAMAAKTSKILNVHELALASKFVDTLDETHDGGDLVSASDLQTGRILVRVTAEGEGARGAEALAAKLDGSQVMGLPVQVVEVQPKAESLQSAIYIEVAVTALTPSHAAGELRVQSRAPRGGWKSLGKASFETSQQYMPETGLADAIDRAMAESFIRVKTVKKAPGLTTVSVENRLPLTIAGLTLRTGSDSQAGSLPIDGLGLGPARTTSVKLPAPTARVERVSFNGL